MSSSSLFFFGGGGRRKLDIIPFGNAEVLHVSICTRLRVLEVIENGGSLRSLPHETDTQRERGEGHISHRLWGSVWWFCKIINESYGFERQNKHLSFTSVNLQSLGNFLLAFFYPSDWEHQEELANILSKIDSYLLELHWISRIWSTWTNVLSSLKRLVVR